MTDTTIYKVVKVATTADTIRLFTNLRKTGHFFTAMFIKKTNGEMRKMNCRFGVKKGVNGKGQKFSPIEKGLLTVWDTEKQEFRMLNLNSLLMIHYKGIAYIF